MVMLCYRFARHIRRSSTWLHKGRPLSQYIRDFSSSDTQGQSDNHYDIVISGGGMVGFAMACCLGQSSRLSDRKILLLEGAPKKDWHIPEEFGNRVCALNRNTQDLFTKLGVWDAMTSMRVQAIRRMQVWEACSEAMICFEENPEEGCLAHIVENDVILEAIKSKIPDQVKVEYSSKVEGYSLPTDTSAMVEINLEGGRSISADLLIGADGAKSLVRQAMGTQYLSWDYDQMGIVATLKLSEAQENTVAWQRFLPTGPVALLPLSHNRSSLVWSTTKEQAKSLLRLSEEDFTDALNRAIWDESASDPVVQKIHERWMNLLNTVAPGQGSDYRQLPPGIGGIVSNSRGAFPLGLGHAVHYVRPRVVLIGDAAHRVHPLAGQGVNLGFGDVSCLLTTLENSVINGSDIGDERELYRYESQRQKHNIATMASIDGLYRLYSTKALPFVLARSLGLSTVNVIPFVKNFFMRHAEG
ncbi:LOW QUALITY PROTEIN: ubiquinone biosynthesis monooxygenase COQ6, mitochondrial-like [Macrobrachium nipponense]|uniref:LOW QUALITY PROTEIN: ubiquinone biosynthesis monooxygenase COQ6, mitochondrial-like n=1 Tax=Macrobrachium nipponense TaxID=159736 RepID=UPI0030C8B243